MLTFIEEKKTVSRQSSSANFKYLNNLNCKVDIQMYEFSYFSLFVGLANRLSSTIGGNREMEQLYTTFSPISGHVFQD